MRCPILILLTNILLAFISGTVIAADEEKCDIAMLTKNSETEPVVRPVKEKQYLIESSIAGNRYSEEKRIPCTFSDLLKLGFEVKTSGGSSPADSLGGVFENFTVLQKGPLVVNCYTQYELGKRELEGKFVWGISVCQQVVPHRLMSEPKPKEKSSMGHPRFQ